MATKLYSGVFFKYKGVERHVTWHFNPPKPNLPAGITAGDEVLLRIVGHYKNDQVECFIAQLKLGEDMVEVSPFTGTLLHITLWTAEGVPPVQSGLQATNDKNNIEWFNEPFYIKGKWDIFEV